jgi:hypothetical protein
MTDDEAVECYMDGWVAFIDDVSNKDNCTVRNDVTPTDPVQRGYFDSHVAYEAARRAEHERLEREVHDKQFLDGFVSRGGFHYNPPAGERIEEAITMLLRLANTTGKRITGTFNDIPLEANPQESPEIVWGRFMAASHGQGERGA